MRALGVGTSSTLSAGKIAIVAGALKSPSARGSSSTSDFASAAIFRLAWIVTSTGPIGRRIKGSETRPVCPVTASKAIKLSGPPSSSCHPGSSRSRTPISAARIRYLSFPFSVTRSASTKSRYSGSTLTRLFASTTRTGSEQGCP